MNISIWPLETTGLEPGKKVAGQTGCQDQPGSRATTSSQAKNWMPLIQHDAWNGLMEASRAAAGQTRLAGQRVTSRVMGCFGWPALWGVLWPPPKLFGSRIRTSGHPKQPITRLVTRCPARRVCPAAARLLSAACVLVVFCLWYVRLLVCVM